jgi:hypothetical protein
MLWMIVIGVLMAHDRSQTVSVSFFLASSMATVKAPPSQERSGGCKSFL